jgi:hypothetical protein
MRRFLESQALRDAVRNQLISAVWASLGRAAAHEVTWLGARKDFMAMLPSPGALPLLELEPLGPRPRECAAIGQLLRSPE